MCIRAAEDCFQKANLEYQISPSLKSKVIHRWVTIDISAKYPLPILVKFIVAIIEFIYKIA